MPNISEWSLEGINGCKLLAMFQRVFKEPIKVAHLQLLTNQLRLNSAYGRNNQQLFLWKQQNIWLRDKARNFLIEKRDMGRGNYLTYNFNRRIKEQQSCLYLDQISLSNEFMRNMLQKKPVGTSFW